MEKVTVISVVALVALLSTNEVRADWQYTKWGSSLDEVKAAKVDSMTLTTAKEQTDEAYSFGKPMAKATYRASGTTFDVHFLFDNDKLAGVVLYMRDLETASRIGSALGDQYGKPGTDSKVYDRLTGCWTVSRSWRDEAAGNVVSFRSWSCEGLNSPKSFHVMYRPILDPSKTGL